MFFPIRRQTDGIDNAIACHEAAAAKSNLGNVTNASVNILIKDFAAMRVQVNIAVVRPNRKLPRCLTEPGSKGLLNPGLDYNRTKPFDILQTPLRLSKLC